MVSATSELYSGVLDFELDQEEAFNTQLSVVGKQHCKIGVLVNHYVRFPRTNIFSIVTHCYFVLSREVDNIV